MHLKYIMETEEDNYSSDDKIYNKIAYLIWEKYIDNYILYINSDVGYTIIENNEIIRKKIDTTYTLDEFIDLINNDYTKYILLSYIKYQCSKNEDDEMLFVISDIISESWNLIILEIKHIINYNMSENK